MAPEPGEYGTLTSEAVRSVAAERLRPLMAGIGTGYRVSPDVMLDVLIYAAATGKSLHSAALALESAPDDTTLRDCLNAAFRPEGVMQLQAQVNKLLLADLPGELFETRQDLAIDFHDLPFYGQVSDLNGWLCRGKARDGTTHFLRVATAYVMRDGLRFTLAVHFVRPTHRTADILSRMLVRVRRAGLKIACLWLDRGFASVAVVRRLENLRIPAVIACPIRGEQGGTRALCRGRASYTTTYTMHGPYGTCCTVPVAVVYGYVKRRGQRRRARWFLYLLIGVRFTPQAVHARYRRRFGIESSYRCLGQVRPRTNSRNPAYRYLCTAIGLVLLNVWTALRFQYCQVRLPAHGFRRQAVIKEDRSLFRLHRLRDFLRHAIEQRHRLCTWILVTPRPATSGNH